ncbi:transposase, partial [Janibacter indicus]
MYLSIRDPHRPAGRADRSHKWHLVALANLMVTQVRQRITRQLHVRRGTATDKVWASRQLLLTGYEHLTVKQKAPGSTPPSPPRI